MSFKMNYYAQGGEPMHIDANENSDLTSVRA